MRVRSSDKGQISCPSGSRYKDLSIWPLRFYVAYVIQFQIGISAKVAATLSVWTASTAT